MDSPDVVPGIQYRTMAKGGKVKVGGPRARANGNGAVVMAPMALSKQLGPRSNPSLRTGQRLTQVRHSECFTTVVSSGTDFQCYSYPCNPGVASCFPWLAAVAARYETYKFRKLVFDFHPRAPSTTAGTVTMAFDFDAADPAPETILQALSYKDREVGSVWTEHTLRTDLLQGDRQPSRYTRVGVLEASHDIKTYDVGNIHICVDGVPAGNVGFMEVTYEVDLYTPQIQSPVGGRSTASTGLDATHLVGSNYAVAEGALPFMETSTSVLTFTQNFDGMVLYVVNGGAGLAADFLPVAAGGATATGLTNLVDAATTSVVGAFRVRSVPGGTLTPTITAAGGVTGITYRVAAAGYNSLN